MNKIIFCQYYLCQKIFRVNLSKFNRNIFNMFKPQKQGFNSDSIEKSVSSKYCFTIEGNIGCGKSTFLQILRRKIPQAEWIEEPVSEWQNLGGKNINILEKYYEQPTRWGFTFQIYALFTRIKALHEARKRCPQKLMISERSILADKFVFSELMKDLGYMDNSEYQIFKSLYQSFEKMSYINETKIIYLRCPPSKCSERTKQRKRQEESEIPLEYLQSIHTKHEKWFNEYDEKKVLVLDTEEDFKDNEQKIEVMFNKVLEFISQQ